MLRHFRLINTLCSRGNDILLTMNKLKQLTYLGAIKNGKLIAPEKRIKLELSQIEDTPDVVIIIRPEKRPKTHEQIKLFHGPMIEQIQAFYMATEGAYISHDVIKSDLKEQFLPKEKQYYSDGSPVMVKIQHPERKGVTFAWHMEKVPSLSDLSIEQMRSFIDAVLRYFLHERGLHIEIHSKE